MKIKTKEEIGGFIKERLKSLNINQSALAEMIAKAKGDGYSKESMKDNVSKWIRGERYPGTEYLYYLAQALQVSINALLLGGDVCDKFEDRPFTVYAVAKSGDIDQLDKIMNVFTPDGTCVGENYDEYDKTIVDYAVEFERVDLIKYMFEKKYLQNYDTNIMSQIRMGNYYTPRDMFNKIISLAIKFDDIDLFKRLVKRTKLILKDGFDSFDHSFYAPNRTQAIVMNCDMIEGILQTKDIFEYLMTPFTASEEEWKDWNFGVSYLKDGKSIDEELKKGPMVSRSFNLFLRYAQSKNLEVAEKIIEIGLKHAEKVLEFLNQYYDWEEISLDDTGRVYCTGQREWGCMSIMPMGLRENKQR